MAFESSILALTNADFSAYTCLAVGVLVLIVGAVLGFVRTVGVKGSTDDAKANIETAERSLEAMQNAMLRAKDATPATEAAEDAGKDATEAMSTAKSALDQAAAIVAALPENLRFAGLLALIGTVLVSVATIQFNGVSLF
jgi:hypothetical protein